MKICELCKSRARICCESDEANLCWDCDFKVHSANFLVAKHLRNLLCHVCQSPTPWNASGEKLGRTISVCERCVRNSIGQEESEGGNDEEIDSDDEDDDEDEGDSDGDDEEDGDIQVVPSSDSAPPPPPASSSTFEESSSGTNNGGRDICLKRLRENSLDLCSEDDPDCTSSDKNIFPPSAPVTVAAAAGCARSSFVDSLPRRPLKSQKTVSNQSPSVHQGPSDSKAIVQTRFHRKPSDGSYNDRRDVDCDPAVSS